MPNSNPTPPTTPTSDNRPIVYFDPEANVYVYRASSVGKPLRCLTAARQSYDPLPAPAYLLAAAEAGNRYEVIVKDRLRADGWDIGGEQSELDIPAAPNTVVRGHMDAEHATPPAEGFSEYGALTLPLEVKSMSNNVWEKWHKHRFDGFPSYAAQIVSYMTGMQATAAWYAVINRDTDELDVILVDLNTTPNLPTWNSIVQKIALSEWFAESNTLPVCDGASEYACPFEYLCDRREILYSELESGDDETLLRLAEQHDEIAKLEKDLKARKADVRDEIAEVMGVAKRRRLPGWSISMTTRKSKRLNTKALRDRLGDELDSFYDETESAPFPTIRRSTGKE